jgi:4-hydroxy-tetrahydrodipicolinate synthase
MKDSSGDWNNTKTFLDAFAVRAGRAVSVDAGRGNDLDMDTQTSFDVFVGSESFLLACMRNGGAGTISATANVNPAAIHKLYTEWVRSRTGGKAAVRDDLDDQQTKLNVVRDVFSRKYLMIAALKQAIAIYADDPAWRTVRPPLVELTPEQAKTLAAELKAISFTMPGIETKDES